ncbi:ParB/RepB/Spo0J family partition protein [uncultured Roseobacter sp.]|uniref:ParB/RepB/Spo0J family partition protein n=1 Tax=uncultured Roseobacter sp. TaxID=114847 RepID=UPI00263920CF|nr:ParB/RepB/Spo0J family partition protein [uncultured Roseobacter sp.]
MQLNHIPLDDLTPAKLNVRKRGGKQAGDLLPSIRAHGLLQPLLVRATENGFEIVAGQRRYYALKTLASEQDDTPPVPCMIMEEGEDAQAIEASLAENLARLPMDEIDQYKAFAALSKQGMSTEDIAARFGITTRLVTQRLAIAGIIPQILSAYQKGDIAPETLRLLTMATKTQQRDWLRLFKSDDNHAPEGYRLKCWLFGGAEIKTDAALFDLDDYKASILSDLFGEDSYFGDSEAFWMLQNTAIAKAKDAYLAEGWTEVVVLDVGEYFPSWDYVTTAKEDGGKVYVHVAHSGEVTFYEGQLSRKEITARSNKSADKPAKPELTAAMQNYLALHRHAAVRENLLAHQGIALRLAVAQMIAGSALWSVQAEPQKAGKEAVRDSLATNKAQQRFTEARSDIAKLLDLPLEAGQTVVPRREDYGAGRDLHRIFRKLCDLGDDEVMTILTFVSAECLSADSAMVEVLGKALGVSLANDWSPDEAFFDLLRDKQAINAIVGEVAGKDIAAQHITSTANVQKSVIKACLEGSRPAKVKNWQPGYIGFPMKGYTDKGGLRAEQLWNTVSKIYKKT